MWRKKHITTFPLERDPQGEFPMGCCKVSTMTMTQKGAVQTTYCFWYWCLVLDFLFMILRKKSRNKHVKIKIYHMAQVIRKDGWEICSQFSMGCCKSVHYSTMIQKDAVQTTWCFDNGFWWLFFFYGFWKQNKKQNGEDQHVPNVTSHLKKMGGGICSNFFRGML